MAKKLKGRANPLAELHFIADVPLEQAVRLIGNLASDIDVVTLTEFDTNLSRRILHKTTYKTYELKD